MDKPVKKMIWRVRITDQAILFSIVRRSLEDAAKKKDDQHRLILVIFWSDIKIAVVR